MRNLSAASERLVVNGVAATQYTQALVRQVSSLERTVRLYQIIPRPALLDTFEQNRDLLTKTLENFSALPGGNDERARVIANMEKTIDTIAAALSSKSPTRITSTLREFTELSRDAGQLSTLASAQTDRELKQLQSETEERATTAVLAVAGADSDHGRADRDVRGVPRAAHPADRRGHRRDRSRAVERAGQGAGAVRPQGPGTPARMAARALAGHRRGTQSLPAPHVARTEDTARQHPRGHRTADGRRGRHAERRSARSRRHPARQQPAPAATDREPALVQRMAGETQRTRGGRDSSACH